MSDDLILSPEALPPELRAWLEANDTSRLVVSVEQLMDGRLLVRQMPDIDPTLLAHIRVTVAKYHEALMNLT